MEPDSIHYDNMESDTTQKSSLDMLNPGNFLQSSWIRRCVCVGNEVDGVLLGYGFNFLLPIGAILWFLFLIA